MSAPVILSNGDIVLALYEPDRSHLVRVDPQGNIVRNFTINGERSSSPESPSGTVDDAIIYGNSGLVYFLDPDLNLLWKSPVDYNQVGDIAVGRNAYYYVGRKVVGRNIQSALVKVLPDGEETHFETDLFIYQPVIDTKGNVLVASIDRLMKFSTELDLIYEKPYRIYSGLTIVKGDSVLAYTGDGLISIDGSGNLEWNAPEYFLPYATYNHIGPLVDSDGTIYAFKELDTMVGLAGDRPIAQSTWPTTRGNSMRTGRALIQKNGGIDLHPDLIISHISTDAESILVGDSITVHVIVQNIGTAASGDSITRIRLSDDVNLTKDDVLPIGADIPIPSIGVGESIELTHEITIEETTSSGRYYIGAFADALSSIGQINEENDGEITSRRITINRKGDHPVIEQPIFQEGSDNPPLISLSVFGEKDSIYNIKLVDVLTKLWTVIKSFVGNDTIEQHGFPVANGEVSETYVVERVDLKLPLPGGNRWLLTTEIGCGDCLPNSIQDSHVGNHYHSLDFDNLNNDSGVVTDVAILAAADGKVTVAAYTEFNGHYVVIDHDYPYDGSGLTTRYLHLKKTPSVDVGQQVYQGDAIGIMGNTGDVEVTNGDGIHLHFGLQYNKSGSEGIPELRSVRLEGKKLEEFIVSDGRAGGGFYLSTNRVLGGGVDGKINTTE
jgi:hypothetical protein